MASGGGDRRSPACAAHAADPVRIGFSIAKTGIFAQAAPSQLNAYELWKEQVNASRRPRRRRRPKRPIEFVVYDDQSNPTEAVRIYEKLITDDKVDLLLAPWGTPIAFRHRRRAGEATSFPWSAIPPPRSSCASSSPATSGSRPRPFPTAWREELVKMLQAQQGEERRRPYQLSCPSRWRSSSS